MYIREKLQRKQARTLLSDFVPESAASLPQFTKREPLLFDPTDLLPEFPGAPS